MIREPRCLITGAHGFIGRHAARCFHNAGYVVDGIGHGSWNLQERAQWGISSWSAADITLEALRSIPSTPDVIVHCAGGSSVGAANQDPLKDFERSVTSTAHVLEYLRTTAQRSRLVYPSSASVYGNCSQSPIVESASLAPVSHYGNHKLIAEQLIRSAARSFSTPAIIVRLFSAYGPGLRKQLLWDACRKLTAGDMQFMGTGDEVRDWIHGEDVGNLLVEAAEHASDQCIAINGGTGHGITTRTILEHLACCLFSYPRAIRFSHVQRNGDPSCYIADTEAARRLCWKPKHDWKNGVAEYVRWWVGEVSFTQLSPVQQPDLAGRVDAPIR